MRGEHINFYKYVPIYINVSRKNINAVVDMSGAAARTGNLGKKERKECSNI